MQTGLLGTVKSVVGGREEPVERTTPEAIDLQATFRRMLDAGDRACAIEVSSHALELGRAEGIRFPAASSPTSRRTTSTSTRRWRTTTGQAPPVRAPGRAGRGEPRRRVRAPAGGRDRRRRDLRDRSRRRLPGARRALRPGGSAFACDTPDGPLEVETRAAGPVQRAERARPRSRRPDSWAGARRDPPRPRRRRPRARPLRAGGRGPGVHGARGLRAHARGARERAARRARDHPRAPACGVRRGRRPRPRQAPADGPRRQRAGRPRGRHLGQPALGGPRGDRRRGAGRHQRRSRARGRPPRRDRAGGRTPRAGRRGGDRRQGPRAGPGVRGRAQGAVRRRDRRARGAAPGSGVGA